MRFRLGSMLAGVLTAALFLGANLVLQFEKQSRLMLCPSDVRFENNFAYVDVYRQSEEWVWISQGWPFCVREQDALTRQVPRDSTPSRWKFSPSTPRYFCDFGNIAINAFVGLIAVLAALAGTEWVLRRRERITTP